jgi:hypothetical protein
VSERVTHLLATGSDVTRPTINPTTTTTTSNGRNTNPNKPILINFDTMSVLGQLYVAALAALALAAAGTAPVSYAWIAPSTTQHTRLGRTAPISSFPTLPSSSSSSSSLIVGHMASRTATKWEKKQEWLENRGFDSLRGGAAADSSSSSVPFAAIVGNGRIGSTLAQAGNCVVVGRDDKIDPDGTGPILIATRNDALDGIIDACPPARRKDLVFMQNGYLDDFLSSKGLLDNTQILLYLSVTAKGADPIDGVTSVNPEGLTAAVGEHAQAFADRLKGLDLKCNVVTPEVYRPAMFEKLMWISTYVSS